MSGLPMLTEMHLKIEEKIVIYILCIKKLPLYHIGWSSNTKSIHGKDEHSRMLVCGIIYHAID
jgi:hypothetical protein